jgi:D-glycero-D-manno-heptose 1,7-bisphosphate phosphatase
MKALRRSAFLDRDGVINRDTGYVHRIADFELLPGVVAALQRLQKLDYALIVVTNQSGLARGLFDSAAYEALTQHLHETLARDGVTLDAVYHCPHLPDATVARYRCDCDCRKPLPGLLLKAIDEYAIDPQTSLLVGDKASDIAAGRAAGVGKCYLVGSEARGTADACYVDLAACINAVT